MRKQIVIDDEIGYKLDKLANQSEFIRQAILEKFNRDKISDSGSEDTKEFMKVIAKLNNLLDTNNEKLDRIESNLHNLDSKFHLAYARIKRFFVEILHGILKLNVMGVQTVGKSWLTENKEAINNTILPQLKETIERVEHCDNR